MKKITFLTVAAVLITLVAASCGQKSASMEFKTIETKEFIKHPMATEDYQGLGYEIVFTYPSGFGDKAILETLQRKFIEYVLDKKYVALTPEEAVKACIEDWKKLYDEDMQEYDETEYILYFDFIHKDTILFVNDVLLQMRHDFYESTGGAHGNGGYAAHLFNLKTGEEYKRNDIFKIENEDQIRALIIAELLKFWEDNDVDFAEEGVWRDCTSFAVSSEGITFLYVDYELGAYYLGCPQITIPFSQILPYLREKTPVWDVAKEKSKQ